MRPAIKHLKRLIRSFLEVLGPTALTQFNRNKPPNENICTINDFLNRSDWQSLTLAEPILDKLITEVQLGKRVTLAIGHTKAFKSCMDRVFKAFAGMPNNIDSFSLK